MLAMKVAAILLMSTILVQAKPVEKREAGRGLLPPAFWSDPPVLRAPTDFQTLRRPWEASADLFDPFAKMVQKYITENDTPIQQVIGLFKNIYGLMSGYRTEVIALFAFICICGIALLGLLVFVLVKMISCLF